MVQAVVKVQAPRKNFLGSFSRPDRPKTYMWDLICHPSGPLARQAEGVLMRKREREGACS